MQTKDLLKNLFNRQKKPKLNKTNSNKNLNLKKKLLLKKLKMMPNEKKSKLKRNLRFKLIK